MELKDIHPNPDNPRSITDDARAELGESMGEFGDLSGFVFNHDGTIISGHQRWEEIKSEVNEFAIRETYETPLPEGTIQRGHFELTDGRKYDYAVRQWSVEKANAAMIRANKENAGTWDVSKLPRLNFNQEEAVKFGVPEIVFGVQPMETGGGKEEAQEKQKTAKAWIPDCLFPSNNIYEIPTLDINGQADVISNPVIVWGIEKRTRKIDGGTVLFYVDDYRFEAIWDNPHQILDTGCAAMAEPNVSIYDTMPISYGLHLIYKKRWIARYLQALGVKVLADLNVSVKFAEYNLLGIPDGWNAFATRGYLERTDYLLHEIETAKKISGCDNPFMVVYGGGMKIREIVAKNNLIYIETFRGFNKNNTENG